jgi:putative two-component system response regulator
LTILERESPHAVVSDLHMPDGCGARFLADAANAKPKIPRILLSADPDFRPKRGSLHDARLFALLAKMDMSRLPRLLVELFECRRIAAGNGADPDAIALATKLARATARPAHEDDAHRERLGRTTRLVAERLGLVESVAFTLRLGAILHDIGQIAVPEHVFSRPGGLGANDRAFLVEHPAAGARLLDDMPALAPGLPVVLGHHERWDGMGYPHRLAGDDIAIAARVFRAADCYDAMRVGRAYRKKRTHEEAMAEVEAISGVELDPEVVRAIASIPEAELFPTS